MISLLKNTMPDLLIRNIDKEILDTLKSKAAKNNRSLQNELHEMLNAYTHSDLTEFRNLVNEIQNEYSTSGTTFSDSVDAINEERNR